MRCADSATNFINQLPVRSNFLPYGLLALTLHLQMCFVIIWRQSHTFLLHNRTALPTPKLTAEVRMWQYAIRYTSPNPRDSYENPTTIAAWSSEEA